MGQRALVTGATGFVGSHLTQKLLAEGWLVSAVVRASSGDSPPGARRLEHDGSTGSMISLLRDARPDVVFHLASLFVAEHTAEQVAPLVESNVLFGAQLLEAMDAVGCRRLVDAATTWQHYRGAEYDPVCLYAATKQAFSDIAKFFVDARGFSRVSLELSDTYGPNDNRPKLFTALRRAADTGSCLDMSPGEQLIDLVFVDDVVSAFEIAASRVAVAAPGESEVFSVGADDTLTLRSLVEAWSGAVGEPSLRVNWGARPYRAREVMIPPCVAPRLPGWAPAVTLAEGLAAVATAPESR